MQYRNGLRKPEHTLMLRSFQFPALHYRPTNRLESQYTRPRSGSRAILVSGSVSNQGININNSAKFHVYSTKMASLYKVEAVGFQDEEINKKKY